MEILCDSCVDHTVNQIILFGPKGDCILSSFGSRRETHTQLTLSARSDEPHERKVNPFLFALLTHQEKGKPPRTVNPYNYRLAGYKKKKKVVIPREHRFMQTAGNRRKRRQWPLFFRGNDLVNPKLFIFGRNRAYTNEKLGSPSRTYKPVRGRLYKSVV